jgi:hypothetical protein
VLVLAVRRIRKQKHFNSNSVIKTNNQLNERRDWIHDLALMPLVKFGKIILLPPLYIK